MALRSNLQVLRSWDDTITLLRQLTGSKDARRLTLLSWKLPIYSIWRERNDRLHRTTLRSSDSIIARLDRLIRTGPRAS